MGLVRAAVDAVGGTLADQWLEIVEPVNMGEGVVFCKGGAVRPHSKRGSNKKGTEDLISDGSAVHVYDTQAMLVVDSGRIAEFTAEPGVYTIRRSEQPSVFSGSLGDSIKETFTRFKYGGVPSQRMQVFYVNLQEIKNIKFGTANALNYYDNFYDAELFLRCHGSYSIKIVDPILFYQQAIPRNSTHVHIDDIKEQYMNEFLEALQSSINQMSVDGIRISQVASKMRELSKYMAETLDDTWRAERGMEINSVGIASISYDEQSRKLLDMRSTGAMLKQGDIREGYVQGSIARGMEAAGSNEAGATNAFLGMGFGMGAAGNFMGAASASNQAQMQQQAAMQAAPPPVQPAGAPAGAPPSQSTQGAQWQCPQCQSANSGKFCPQCGTPAPAPAQASFCSQCGNKFEGAVPKFCPQCGNQQ